MLDLIGVCRRRYNQSLAAAAMDNEGSIVKKHPHTDGNQGLQTVRRIESAIKHTTAVVNDVVNDREAPERTFAAIDAV